MPSPSMPTRWSGAYDRLYNLAEDFTVEFEASEVWLSSHKHNGTDRIYDAVDDVYAESVDAGLGYDEIQVLSAIALINASDFKASENMAPGDRSYDA